jgi:hypothetical protein
VNQDPAKGRFFMIAAHRVIGAALVLLGVLCLEGVLDWGETLGWALVGLGVIDVFIVPIVLTRLWRTPRP